MWKPEDDQCQQKDHLYVCSIHLTLEAKAGVDTRNIAIALLQLTLYNDFVDSMT